MAIKKVPSNAMLIPDEAELAFHGEIYDVFQWDQKLFDGTSIKYEMLKRTDTMQVIAIKDGKIIAIDEQQAGRPKYLRLPGGRVEKDETWLEAAKRECLEELGMRFNTWKLIYVRQPIVKIEWFVATFLAADFAGQQPVNLDAGEKIQVLEMTLEELIGRFDKESSPVADYAKLELMQFKSIDQIEKLPEFTGNEVDR